VERAIRYIRDNFFAGRTFTDLNDLNAQAEAWMTPDLPPTGAVLKIRR
jgi:transposase